ncbi:Nucleotide-binding protein, UspA family [Halanaeroarchaeum sp. HSR-CO]|uniref:universal stress protein n=1 Tax=Halanaeroarchaeum sp. HSR-CO TaxID=2866382 RepID=UPI00217DA14B|nr:universal stress protein [Halanaeroarchaeum sp. HSR-CO]UWG46359.1 Nucleotide-binding protein, UspA family [Halanaeroarchaeum sp. HSR-CO]
MAPAHVLVPLDGSPLAADALAFALETFECRTTVLNVVTPLDRPMSEGGVLDADERQEAARKRADRLIEQAKGRAQEAGRAVETEIETGDPANTILEFVEEYDVDHVVMGGHGGPESGLARRLLGTVATRVVGETPVTVTVVR